jgi:multidrug resistance efflux pump
VDWQTEQEELARVERLFAEGLVADAEVGRARAKTEKARLAYQEALIELASVQPRLSVQRAIKR